MKKHVVFIEMSATGAGERCLEYSLSRGYTVTLVTKCPHNHTLPPAHNLTVVECETNDPRCLLNCVTLLNDRCRIDGITTTHDEYVPSAALAADTLGLNSLRPEAASAVRNKYSMRLNIQRYCPDLNPLFRLVDTERQALQTAHEWGLPLVAKPQDGNDSKYVVRINTEAQLIDYTQTALTWHKADPGISPGILLESYIAGDEFSVETAQHPSSEIELLAVTGKELLGADGRHFSEVGIYLPFWGSQAALLFNEVSRALSYLNLDCGVIHTECRIYNGKVKILEINPRLAGDMTGSHMIELALGASPIEQVVEIALGNLVPWQPSKRRAAGKYAVCMPKTGIFAGIDNIDEIMSAPGVECVRVMASPGTLHHYPPRSNLDLLARVITTSDTAVSAFTLAKRAARLAQVRLS